MINLALPKLEEKAKTISFLADNLNSARARRTSPCYPRRSPPQTKTEASSHADMSDCSGFHEDPSGSNSTPRLHKSPVTGPFMKKLRHLLESLRSWGKRLRPCYNLNVGWLYSGPNNWGLGNVSQVWIELEEHPVSGLSSLCKFLMSWAFVLWKFVTTKTYFTKSGRKFIIILVLLRNGTVRLEAGWRTAA